jgi:hypothetical protein
VYLSTTWIDGRLHYRIVASPGKIVEDARAADYLSTNKFTILLYDEGGFKLGRNLRADKFNESNS